MGLLDTVAESASVFDGNGEFLPVQAGTARRAFLRQFSYASRASGLVAVKRDYIHFARGELTRFLPAAFRAGHLVELRILSEQRLDNRGGHGIISVLF